MELHIITDLVSKEINRFKGGEVLEIRYSDYFDSYVITYLVGKVQFDIKVDYVLDVYIGLTVVRLGLYARVYRNKSFKSFKEIVDWLISETK